MAMPVIALIFCLLFFLPHGAGAIEAAAIIKQVEDNLNGKTAVLTLTMQVETGRTTRTMEMISYSVGHEKSFVKILYPGKDKGITFLKLDNSMWQYVPRIEKIIKIPASMMLQSWMGSDFTNDDLVKSSSLSRDYRARLLSETGEQYSLELLPHEDAPVVWGKIVLTVEKKFLLPVEVLYYDEEDNLIRRLSYREITRFGHRYLPARWEMTPLEEDKKGHRTLIAIAHAVFDRAIDEAYFSKRALKRFSE